MNIKKTFSFLALNFILFTSYALPGFKSPVQDIPGEYVYYRDTTFQRESYVGFLTYDETTYAARYFSPADEKKSLPEKNIKLYITVNPDVNYMDLTGEKFENGFSMSREDTEIVNYIHDMLYELNARRIKAGNSLPVSTDEEFLQFGGNVQVNYDNLVPLFNVRSVVNQTEGKKVFYAVTCGRIHSSDDNSFDAFKGFPASYKDNRHKMTRTKKASPVEAVVPETGRITLDSSWKKALENLYLLGDAAVLTLDKMPPVDSQLFLLRQMMLSSGTSYVDWNYLDYSQNDGITKIKLTVYSEDSKNVTESIKTIISEEDACHVMVLSVFKNIYEKNSRYFDKITQSYSD